MKVIFLDFDGVLNSVEYHKRRYEQNPERLHERKAPCLDPAAIAVLNEVVEKTGALVVVTSTWRIGEPRVHLCDWLRDAGYKGFVLGATIRIPGARRGVEIQDWLDHAAKHPPARLGPVTHFVILDDDTDMEHLYDKLVKVDDQRGLTAEYLPAILKHLEG